MCSLLCCQLLRAACWSCRCWVGPTAGRANYRVELTAGGAYCRVLPLPAARGRGSSGIAVVVSDVDFDPPHPSGWATVGTTGITDAQPTGRRAIRPAVRHARGVSALTRATSRKNCSARRRSASRCPCMSGDGAPDSSVNVCVLGTVQSILCNQAVRSNPASTVPVRPTCAIQLRAIEPVRSEPRPPRRRHSAQQTAPTGDLPDERSRKKAAQTHNLAATDRTVQTCPVDQSPGGHQAQPHSSCLARTPYRPNPGSSAGRRRWDKGGPLRPIRQEGPPNPSTPDPMPSRARAADRLDVVAVRIATEHGVVAGGTPATPEVDAALRRRTRPQRYGRRRPRQRSMPVNAMWTSRAAPGRPSTGPSQKRGRLSRPRRAVTAPPSRGRLTSAMHRGSNTVVWQRGTQPTSLTCKDS